MCACFVGAGTQSLALQASLRGEPPFAPSALSMRPNPSPPAPEHAPGQPQPPAPAPQRRPFLPVRIAAAAPGVGSGLGSGTSTAAYSLLPPARGALLAALRGEGLLSAHGEGLLRAAADPWEGEVVEEEAGADSWLALHVESLLNRCDPFTTSADQVRSICFPFPIRFL